jgi:hypothetical protein
MVQLQISVVELVQILPNSNRHLSSFTWTIGTITEVYGATKVGLGATINQTPTNPSNATAGTAEYSNPSFYN